jgi:hypothetical protein
MKNVQTAGLARLAPRPVLVPATVAVVTVAVGQFAASGVWWDIAWTAAGVSALAGALLVAVQPQPRTAATGRCGRWRPRAGCSVS